MNRHDRRKQWSQRKAKGQTFQAFTPVKEIIPGMTLDELFEKVGRDLHRDFSNIEDRRSISELRIARKQQVLANQHPPGGPMSQSDDGQKGAGEV